MRNKIIKRIVSFALTVTMLAGISWIPAYASDQEDEVGTAPEFSVNFLDETGQRQISKIDAGRRFQAVISVNAAENLTGFVLRLHYDKSQIQTLDADWHGDLNSYETNVCEGDEDALGTALYAQKDINYDTIGLPYTNVTWSLVNQDVHNIITTKGMGSIDLCVLHLQVKDDAELGDFAFCIERVAYLEHGYSSGVSIEEEPIVKNTIKVEAQEEELQIPLVSFELNKSSMKLDMGKGFLSEELKIATLQPENTTDELFVKWSSERPDIADVSQNGVVTAKAWGWTTITATILNSNNEALTKRCEVMVVDSITGTWKQDSGGWWFQKTDGTYPAGCWAYIDDDYYYFNASGYMAAGKWVGDYYVGSDGAMKRNCWVGSYYVGNDGVYVCDAWVDGGKYYVDSNGVYKTGWLKLDNVWYYLDGSGALKKGWILVGGTWYYGDLSTGALYESCWLDDTYYFYSGGAMATGWAVVDGVWYYFGSDGAKRTNQWVGSYWLNKDGSMAMDAWVDLERYHVDANGVYQTGWLKLGETWYYLGSSGLRTEDWMKIGGSWYYFYRKDNTLGKDWGEMAYNCVIDGCVLDADGRWIE